MTRLLREPGLAEDLRARGIDRARTFSWRESARRLVAELERASGLRAGAGRPM